MNDHWLHCGCESKLDTLRAAIKAQDAEYIALRLERNGLQAAKDAAEASVASLTADLKAWRDWAAFAWDCNPTIADGGMRETICRLAEQQTLDAVASLTAKAKERDDAHDYLSRLFVQLAPQCRPFDRLDLLVTQIDNYIAGVHRDRASLTAKLEALNAPPPNLRESAKSVGGWVYAAREDKLATRKNVIAFIEGALKAAYQQGAACSVRMVEILRAACDRDWKDETPEQVATIAANAIHWREQQVSTLTAEVARLKEAYVKLQRHRDHWRAYAYGKRDKPADFLDGNMVDRPATAVETLTEQVKTLRAQSWCPMSAEAFDGSTVLLWMGGVWKRPEIGRFIDGLWHTDRGRTESNVPTHWQPLHLPAPPSSVSAPETKPEPDDTCYHNTPDCKGHGDF